MLTGWKKEDDLAFLAEVSSVPLQQALRHLQVAFPNFFAKRAKEKDSINRAKARLKVARVHARIADRRRDHLHKLSTRLVRENQTIVVEDLTVRNMVKNHSLARAIAAGLVVSAGGSGARPQRENCRTGQSPMKQETPGATQGIPRFQAWGGSQD